VTGEWDVGLNGNTFESGNAIQDIALGGGHQASL
jgi:hypothetical protein